MTAAIEEFYNKSDVPAWHKLGINDPSDHTAEEALKRFRPDGSEPFTIEKAPMKIILGEKGDRHATETGYYMLVRSPIPSDPVFRPMGTPVSDDFEIFTPLRIAQLCDEHICTLDGAPVSVETLGILSKGEQMFVSYRLPSVDIKGDEVAMYLLFHAPMVNGTSLGGYTTGVRTVCQNTLKAGIAAATCSFTVTHSKGAAEQVARWLSEMYSRSLEARDLLKEAYDVLAVKKVKLPAMKWIASNVYPMPNRPDPDAAAARVPFEDRLKMYEANCTRIETVRADVVSLFDGGGIGMDTKAAKGTAFGAYNAVAQYETYRRGSADRAIRSLINGNRSERIENAFTLTTVAEQYQTVSVPALGLHNVMYT